jgi:hypothetical protein
MKHILLLFCCLSIASVCSADMTIVGEFLDGRTGKNGIGIVKIKGSKQKTSLEASPLYQIIDLNAKTITEVDPDLKIANVTALDSWIKAMNQQIEVDMSVNYQKTGKAKTVNGFPCQEYTLTYPNLDGMAGRAWITDEVDIAEYEPFRTLEERIQKTSNRPIGFVIWEEIEITRLHDGQKFVSTRTSVTSISRDAIPDAEFVIPKDYKIKKWP